MAVPPQPLGLKRSFGFGDRLGCATPGHIEAVRGMTFAPIFAQQSIRELTRTQRQPGDVMNAAILGVNNAGWQAPWGADADHLQTREDVFRMAQAGFCMFTVDPSAHVNNQADGLHGDTLDKACAQVGSDGQMTSSDVFDRYLGKRYDLAEAISLAFDDRTALQRAMVKYGPALIHTRRMADWIAEACGQRPYEIEMSVDETATPTSPLEHLFVGLELKRLGVRVISLAPRFVGDFEKGIDYKGSLDIFERHYRQHAAIARFCGPYKLSIHSGSDKFSIYPIIGRLSGDLVHVKTAGTSYLEALRVVCRADRSLFREVAAYCRGRYDTDKASYHVSASVDQVPERVDDTELEKWYLDHNAGRQILHVTFGAVLTIGVSSRGQSFREVFLEVLRKNDDMYRSVLNRHLGRHLQLLGD